MTFNLKVMSFNCHSMTNAAKRAAIFAHLRQLNAQIILLQETFSKPFKEVIWADEWIVLQALFNSLSQNNKTASGTAIVLDHSPLVFGPIKKDVDGRVVAAEVKNNGFVINVINIYAPVSCQSISTEGSF